MAVGQRGAHVEKTSEDVMFHVWEASQATVLLQLQDVRGLRQKFQSSSSSSGTDKYRLNAIHRKSFVCTGV